MRYRLALPLGTDLLKEAAPHDPRCVDLLDKFTRNRLAGRVHMTEVAAALRVPANERRP